MPITAWVLADRRAVPYNYMAVTPDLDDEQLWLGGASYQTAVTRAVDDAGGRAFVTDYAGEVPSFRIATPSIEDLRTVTDAGQFVRELQARGFTGDAQLLALLLRFVPPPEGDDATSFYNCIVNDWCGSYDAYLASLPFDPNAFVDALTEAIVAPRERADAMLAAHSKLTRLFTTMSAEEMTEDPVFVLREMADVSNVHTATMRVECGPDYFYWSAPQTLVLPSGREHVISAGIPYTGSDAEYCDDVETGLFGPGVSVEVSMRTSEMRASSAGGGGGCTAAPAAPGTGALFAAGVALALVARRRRRW
jgi:MYXO-CTERM domain-containing protein